MKKTHLTTSLQSALATMLASTAIFAQPVVEQTPSVAPGLYVTVDHSEIYIIQGDQQIDLKVGEAAFAGQDNMERLDEVPGFLDWPCGGSSEDGMVPTYSIDSLPSGNRVEEIVNRFFEGPEIPGPPPTWLNGESHGNFPADEIERFSSNAYWYQSSESTAKLEALRPNILLVSLYFETQQVVVDRNHFQALRDHFGEKDIPVTFIFNEGKVLPISHFGKNVSLQEVADAYFTDGTSITDAPIWYAGDSHMTTSPEVFEQLFEIPAIADIDPERFAELVKDLQSNGFTKKPVIVLLMGQNSSMSVDEGEKIRAAQSLGMNSIPIVFFYFNQDSHKKRCGLAMPKISSRGGIGEGGVASASLSSNTSVSAAESRLAREALLPPEPEASKN